MEILYYSQLWENNYEEEYIDDSWTKNDSRLSSTKFENIHSQWNKNIPLRTLHKVQQTSVIKSISLGGWRVV